MPGRTFFRLLALTAAWSGLFSAPAAQAAEGAPITIKGSDTMLILNQEWADAFEQDHPGVTVEVQGGGSGTGITALIDGSADLAALSRKIKPEEITAFEKRTGRRPTCLEVAQDGLAIFVNDRNPVTVLTLDQLKDIFSGQVQKWSKVGGWSDGGIIVYTRDEKSGSREFLASTVLKGAPFAPSSRVLPTTRGVESAVSTEPLAIGYGGVAYSPGTRVVRVANPENPAGLGPTVENVSSGRYPLSRKLHLCFDIGNASPLVAEFVRFALKPEGQEIVQDVGYYPLTSSSKGPAAKVVRVTPASMTEQGFDLAVQVIPGAEGDLDAWLHGQVKVQVALRSVPSTAGTARPPRLLIGDRLSVPLRVARQHPNAFPKEVDFTLTPALFREAALRIVFDPAAGEGAVTYEIQVSAFLKELGGTR